MTAARRAQSSVKAAVVLPSTLITTRPGVGQSLSVATQVGGTPRRGSTLILKLVMLSIQLGDEDEFSSPATAERIAAAFLPVTTTVTAPSEPLGRTELYPVTSMMPPLGTLGAASAWRGASENDMTRVISSKPIARIGCRTICRISVSKDTTHSVADRFASCVRCICARTVGRKPHALTQIAGPGRHPAALFRSAYPPGGTKEVIYRGTSL
jgi:hypothetical protein